MDKHILANHEEDIECQACSQTFNPGSLRWHILLVHCHNKTNNCSLCENSFNDKKSLDNHIREIHLSLQERKALSDHLRRANETIRKYECSYCEKTFEVRNKMYNHIRSIHLGEKTKCPLCEKDISVDNFSRHVREFHEQIKKPCPHCGNDFGMSNLSKHIRETHRNELTKCRICEKEMTNSNLNQHIKSVHEKLKRICEICHKVIPQRSFSVHRRKLHNIGKPLTNTSHKGPEKEDEKSLDCERENMKIARKMDNQNEKILENVVLLADKNFTFSKLETFEQKEANKGIDKVTWQVGAKQFSFSIA